MRANPQAMLATTLPLDQFPIVSTPAWAMERKWDGWRQLVTTGPDGPAGFSREGNRRPLPAALQAMFSTLTTDALFDGELVQGRFYLFDMPWYADAEPQVTWETPWARRQIAIRKVLDRWSPDANLLIHVRHVVSSEDKLTLLEEIQTEGGEGVVFKRLDSRYMVGESDLWRRHKFVQDVDVVVVGAGHEGKDNYVLAMADETGDLILPGGIRGREVGRVSGKTGDAKHGLVEIGKVVSVKIVGVGSSGRLVEPTMPRVRDDKSPAECTIDQLATIREIRR